MAVLKDDTLSILLSVVLFLSIGGVVWCVFGIVSDTTSLVKEVGDTATVQTVELKSIDYMSQTK